MFWNDEEQLDTYTTPDKIIDVSFKISCQQIKMDHAWLLTDAIHTLLPPLKEDPQTSIHHIYIPQSGNGWTRTDNFKDKIVQLSRRTRLKIRIPKNKLPEVLTLSGQTILIENIPLTFGQANQHLLSTITTIVARHVHIPDTDENEEEFLQQAHQQIQAMGIKVRKMLCGKSHQLKTPDGYIKTRSLMIADITPEESILLQENGIGLYYNYGCGVFIPQKSITAVNTD